MWRRSEIRFALDSALSEGDVATIRIETPAGDLLVMGEPVQDISGNELRVRFVHTNARFGSPLAANKIGAANLQVIAPAFLVEFDYERLIVEGAVHTSGKREGTRPRAFRFARHSEPASEP